MPTIDVHQLADTDPLERAINDPSSHLGSLTIGEHHALQDVFGTVWNEGLPWVDPLKTTRLTSWQAARLLSLLEAYEPRNPAHAGRADVAAKLAAILRPAVDAGDGVVFIGP
ncbi:MAG TPA: hypothetical protein VF796_19655 [Humisphaera sp.]